MRADIGQPQQHGPVLARIDQLDAFCRAVLKATGADDATVDAATRAMMHGSRLGIDSHGVRLLDHYVTALSGGRVKIRPSPAVVRRSGAVAVLDADHAHGALAGYSAMAEAVALAEQHGLGAVSIRNTSHFGPAGAYALAAAEAGCIGLSVCNSDSFVRLHNGAERFHGTNPIAFAAPLVGDRPWLLDMATSSITYNRVQLYKSTSTPLPEGVASADGGADSTIAALAEMLAPLGGLFGFKGAGLAGMVEILSAVLSGMNPSPDILPMGGPDLSTPRLMGAFVLALQPDAFIDRSTFDAGIRHYLEALRNSQSRAGAAVMAPGDREWAEERNRQSAGVPLDPDTVTAFVRLAAAHHLERPFLSGSES